MMKYNFVLFSVRDITYKYYYHDILNNKNVKFIDDYYPKTNKLNLFLFRFHYSIKINRFINIPFKSLWYPYFFKNDFVEEKPLCFIIMGTNLILLKFGYLDYLKRNFPGAKFVCFFQDLLSKSCDFLSLDQIKTSFNLILSFDKYEALRYGFQYFINPYSQVQIKNDQSYTKSDIFFIGRDKNRLNKIISICEFLQSFGLKCQFFIVGVKSENQIYCDGVTYIDWMSYDEILQRINNTQCLLDVVQDFSVGYTIRVLEAVVFNKKILSNNGEILNAPFYNSCNICYFDSLSEIQSEFLVDFNREVNYGFRENVSPNEFLKYISNYFN